MAVSWAAVSPSRGAPSAGSPGAELPDVSLVLRAAQAPPPQQIVRLSAPDVQESCVGRDLPGDVEAAGAMPAVIDGNPRTSWHCDGDGARLRPPQFLAVFFPRALTLTRVGMVGYDTLRPCRFVTLMELVIGAHGYLIRLPAAAHPRLRWFAVPPARTGQLVLVVRQTKVPSGRTGPVCARTAIAEVSFAAQR